MYKGDIILVLNIPWVFIFTNSTTFLIKTSRLLSMVLFLGLKAICIQQIMQSAWLSIKVSYILSCNEIKVYNKINVIWVLKFIYFYYFISILIGFWIFMMQICLSFYEIKNKQVSWFSNKIERLYWEQWDISLNVVQHPKAHSNKSHHSKVADPGGAVDCFCT